MPPFSHLTHNLTHTGKTETTTRNLGAKNALGKCQDEFAALTKNIKVRRGESEEGYHTEKVL